MDPSEVPGMYLRKSSTMAYGFCPFRFALDFLLELPTEQTEVMAKGTEFHENVWLLYQLVDRNRLMDGTRTITEEYSRHLPDEEVYHNFIEMEIHRWDYLKEIDRLDTFFPLLTEQRMINHELKFTGTVDRVDMDEEDEYIICDYKTSVAIKDWMKSHYRFELMGYKVLVDSSENETIRTLIKKPITKLCIIFPKPMDVFYVPKIKSVTEKAFYRRIEKVRNGIYQGDFHKCDASSDSRMCAVCPRWESCIMGEYDVIVEDFADKVIKAVKEAGL